jgi:phosphomannomutase
MVELISVTNKSLSELLDEIHERYGQLWMEERDYTFSKEKKKELYHLLFVEKRLPVYTQSIRRISYEDGMKIYFEQDGWIIVRFSGTEPVLRIYSEMETMEQVQQVTQQMEEFLRLKQN